MGKTADRIKKLMAERRANPNCCPKCEGVGSFPEFSRALCPICKGKGVLDPPCDG